MLILIIFEINLRVLLSQTVDKTSERVKLPTFLETFPFKSHFQILNFIYDDRIDFKNYNPRFTDNIDNSDTKSTENEVNFRSYIGKNEKKALMKNGIASFILNDDVESNTQNNLHNKSEIKIVQKDQSNIIFNYEINYLQELQIYITKITSETYNLYNITNKAEIVYNNSKNENQELRSDLFPSICNKRKINVQHFAIKKTRYNESNYLDPEMNFINDNSQMHNNYNYNINQTVDNPFIYENIKFIQIANIKILETYKKEIFDYLLKIQLKLYQKRINKNRNTLNNKIKNSKKSHLNKKKQPENNLCRNLNTYSAKDHNDNDSIDGFDTGLNEIRIYNYKTPKLNPFSCPIDNLNSQIELNLHLFNDYEILYYNYKYISNSIYHNLKFFDVASEFDFSEFLKRNFKSFNHKKIINEIDSETSKIFRNECFFANKLFVLADKLSDISTVSNKADFRFGVNYFLALLRGNLSDFTKFFPEFIFFEEFIMHQKTYDLEFTKINFLQFIYFTYVLKKVSTFEFYVHTNIINPIDIENLEQKIHKENLSRGQKFTHFNFVRFELRKILAILLQPFLKKHVYTCFLKFCKFETFKVISEIKRYKISCVKLKKPTMLKHHHFLIKILFFFVNNNDQNFFTVNYHINLLKQKRFLIYLNDSFFSTYILFDRNALSFIDNKKTNKQKQWSFHYTITMIIAINNLFIRLRNHLELFQERIRFWIIKLCNYIDSDEFTKVLNADNKFYCSDGILNQIYLDGAEIICDALNFNGI